MLKYNKCASLNMMVDTESGQDSLNLSKQWWTLQFYLVLYLILLGITDICCHSVLSEVVV